MPFTPQIRDYLKDVALRHGQAARGEQGTIITEAAAFLGWSEQRVYRQMRKLTGWHSGRKARADKGSTSQDMEAVKTLAALMKTGIRANGKPTMHAPTAISVGLQNNAPVTVSPSRFNTLLRQHNLSLTQQQRPSAHVQMRSLHPNHVHQVDASLCLVYYLKGKQYVIRDDQLYKNKLDGLAKVQFKCWRYVLYDHASAVVIPWYCNAAGENQKSLFEFLMFAWSRLDNRPFYGVPKLLVWDKGSANMAAAIKALLEALEVPELSHAVGNSRAKGGVENAQNLIETHFECRLKSEPVDDVAALNEAAFHWANAYNADCIPGADSRLHRHGITPIARYELWSKHTDAHIRTLPDVEACRALLTGATQTRKVAGHLQISFRHPVIKAACRYDLSGLDGVSVGDVVRVSPLLYGDAAILIHLDLPDGAERAYRLERIADYNEFGFRMTAPVIGEAYSAHAATPVEREAKALDRIAYGDKPQAEIDRAKQKNATPFGGTLDAHSHLKNVAIPTYLTRRGSEISVPQRAHAEERPLNVVQAAQALRALLGDAWNGQLFLELQRRYPEGVAEARLAEVAGELTTPAATPLLRAV